MELKAQRGLVDGPGISDLNGKAYSTRDMSSSLIEILEDLFDTNRAFFPLDITSKELLKDRYQAFRSYRRSSDTRATEEGVAKADIDLVNRWETVERAKCKRQNMPMRLHYTQVELILKPFLRYTWAM